MSVVKLKELEQVSLGVLERRDPHVAEVLEVLHELDARVLEPAALLRDVVRFETDDVAGGIRRPAPDFAVGAERYRRRIRLAEDDEARRLETDRQTQDITVEREKLVEVLTPDRRHAQTLDHWSPPGLHRVDDASFEY